MLMTTAASEMAMQMKRLPRKSILRPVMMCIIEMRLRMPALIAQEKSMRVTSIAENTEAMMPTMSVTAKPLIGPLACQNRMTAVMSVVTLASKMTLKAFS